MKVLAITLTHAGRQLARRLPYEHVHGSLGETVRQRWDEVDAFVLFASAGVAVRTVAPLIRGKHEDPAVVVVDEQGQWTVPLIGGHGRGANAVAREVAALLGATAVLTTATDARGIPALDALPGFACRGDVAGVTRALLDHDEVALSNPSGWPLPPRLSDLAPLDQPRLGGAARIVVDHHVHPGTPGCVTLHPRRLVVGVGASTGAAPAEAIALVAEGLERARLAPESVAAVATLDRKRDEPGIVAVAEGLGVPVISCAAEDLARLAVPNPSEVVRAAVGTGSVCEAAALLVAGPGAELVVAKSRSATSTMAIAIRARPAGHLQVVGLGPGAARHRTPAATAALGHADVVIGYGPYLASAGDAINPSAEVVSSPIGEEVERCTAALAAAARGDRVALVCSGDAGVYALATLVFELAPQHPSLDPLVDIEVVPGVTAALTSAAVLGAPLGHDHAAISLSDLLTPWSVITERLNAVAVSDLVVSLYNPRSAGRDWQLASALQLLGACRPAGTPVGIVTDAGRVGEQVTITTLADLDPTMVGMTSCVIVGASTTRVVGGRMVTPRGYQP